MFQASCHRSEHAEARVEAEPWPEAETWPEAEAEAEEEEEVDLDEFGVRRKRALQDEEIRNTVSSPTLKIHHRHDKNREQEENKSRMNKDYYDPSKSKIPILKCIANYFYVFFLRKQIHMDSNISF